MDVAELRRKLVNHFSASELRDLCFDLGIDYENLPRTGKLELAREMVAYLERRRRIPDLLEKISRLRPEVFSIGAPETITFADGEQTTRQRQQLQHRLDGLQQEWELRNKKINRLRAAWAIEASAAVKFQLEHEIRAEEAQLETLAAEIDQIEERLQ